MSVSVILICLLIIATLENFWPFIIGYSQTPNGMIFLGTVHHPADYFYYLSQFAQGSYRTLTTIDLYTSEHLPPTMIGWSNVLLGKLFSLFHLSPIIAYHTSVFFLTALLFFTAYRLSQNVLKSRTFAVLSLYLFTLFHAFPVMREGFPSYGDYWNNFAVPRVRFGAVPHQLLLAVASIFLVLGVFQWVENKRSWKILLRITCSSIILGSLQPVLWALTVGALSLSYIVSRRHTNKHVPIGSLLQSAIALGTGAIPVLYLTRIFQALPFSQLKAWEATQQTWLTPEHFLTATGPIFLIALASIPTVLRRITIERVFLVVFSLVSILLLLSPIPALFGISHVRFMSTLTILSLVLLAVHGLQPLLQTNLLWVKRGAYIFLAALSLILIPNHIKTIELSSSFTPNNLYQYLSHKDYDFFRLTASISHVDDTFLVLPPYNELFPAISARRSFSGHPLLTINSAQKDAITASFFADSLDSEAMHQLLQKNSIKWVISTPNQQKLITASWASVRAKSDNLVLYAIQ